MTLHAAGISPVTYDSPVAMATGTFTGDTSGAGIAVAIGFIPKVVVLIDMAASTGCSRYEWVQGMAATDSLLTNGTTDPAIDANSAVVTAGKLFTQTEVGVYKPGAQSADDGTLTNTGSQSIFGQDSTATALLTFGINVNAHTYVWYAFG